MNHQRAAWKTKYLKSRHESKCHRRKLYHFAGFLYLSHASMLAFVEHSYPSSLSEIWHRSMVCRPEDICYNLGSQPHTSHDDFDTDDCQLWITLYVYQGTLTGTHARDTLTPPL